MSKKKSYTTLKCSALIGITILLCFWLFIIGKKFIMPKDWTSDALQQIWPNLLYLFRHTVNGHIPSWNFANGLGTRGTEFIAITDFLSIMLGPERIPYALNILFFVKIIISGSFFCNYVKLVTNNEFSAIILGISYAFCSPMMLRGIWRGYPNEIMFVAIVLYATEKFAVGEWKKRFPFVIAIFSWTVGAYYACLYLMVFCAYYFYKVFSQNCGRESCKKYISYVTAYLIGFLLNIYNIFDFVYEMSHTARIVFSEAEHSIQLFSVKDMPLVFITSINPVLFGTEDRTYTNILEGPEFYCGILLVLILPQVLCLKDKRLKKWHMCMLASAGFYCICPLVRVVASGGGRTAAYKSSSFWIILVLLIVATNLWKNFNENGISLKLLNLTCTLIILCYILCRIYLFILPIQKSDIITIGLIIIYCLAFNLHFINRLSWQGLRKLLFCLGVFEVLLFFRGMYNEWDVLTSEDLSTDVFYNYTGNSKNKLIQKIKETDSEVFYRMEEIGLSASHCDPLAYGYYGVLNYTGGVTNSQSLVKFMRSVSQDNAEMVTALRNFGNNIALNTFVGIKYILTCADSGIYGYSYIAQEGEIQAYKNENALSLGYTYDRYMDEESFMNISIENRGMALLEGCVLEDEILKQYVDKMDCEVYRNMYAFDSALYQRNVDERKRELFKVQLFKEDYIEGTIESKGDKILFFSIPYDSGWKIWIDGEEEELYSVNNGLIGTHISEGKHFIVLKYVDPIWKYSVGVAVICSIFYIVYVVKLRKS